MGHCPAIPYSVSFPKSGWRFRITNNQSKFRNLRFLYILGIGECLHHSAPSTHAIQSVLRVTPEIFYKLSNKLLSSFDTVFFQKLRYIIGFGPKRTKSTPPETVDFSWGWLRDFRKMTQNNQVHFSPRGDALSKIQGWVPLQDIQSFEWHAFQFRQSVFSKELYAFLRCFCRKTTKSTAPETVDFEIFAFSFPSASFTLSKEKPV